MVPVTRAVGSQDCYTLKINIRMDLGLKGKVAVVTGASRGLGKAIATQLAAEGCRLVICARGEEVLSSAREEITQLYDVPVLAQATDLTVPGQPQELIEAAVSEYGTVQLLVNNAGGNRRGKFRRFIGSGLGGYIDIEFENAFACQSGSDPSPCEIVAAEQFCLWDPYLVAKQVAPDSPSITRRSQH